MQMPTADERYTTNEIADALDVSVSTVRKYIRTMENCDYQFYKTNGNMRIYVEKDVRALSYLNELRKNSNCTIETAAEKMIEKFGKAKERQKMQAPKQTKESKTVRSKEYEELKSLILKQTELIESLSEQIQNQKETIDKQFVEHDRYIMDKMNQHLEAKKLIAAAEEEEKEKEKENEKPNFFGKLFGNNTT